MFFYGFIRRRCCISWKKWLRKTRLIKLIEDFSAKELSNTTNSLDNPYKNYLDIEYEGIPESTEKTNGYKLFSF